ncbi:hypothetical protein C8Q77DRAFT_915610 [Trametes polyzona]|nr:hypothetical protein C8Q77DRAFT_915610 [Trametes polyzona]
MRCACCVIWYACCLLGLPRRKASCRIFFAEHDAMAPVKLSMSEVKGCTATGRSIRLYGGQGDQTTAAVRRIYSNA